MLQVNAHYQNHLKHKSTLQEFTMDVTTAGFTPDINYAAAICAQTAGVETANECREDENLKLQFETGLKSKRNPLKTEKAVLRGFLLLHLLRELLGTPVASGSS